MVLETVNKGRSEERRLVRSCITSAPQLGNVDRIGGRNSMPWQDSRPAAQRQLGMFWIAIPEGVSALTKNTRPAAVTQSACRTG